MEKVITIWHSYATKSGFLATGPIYLTRIFLLNSLDLDKARLCGESAQLLTHVKTWYQISTDVKNWCLIFTDVNDNFHAKKYLCVLILI